MAPSFKLEPCTASDASAMATCFFTAFHHITHPQSEFYKKMFPETANVQDFFTRSLAEQMRREPRTVFLRVVDANADNKLAGWVKWTPPNSEESYWEDFTEEMDAELCEAFFEAMAVNRAKLTGGQAHWYLELMSVAAEYARQGAGAMMMQHGCELVDKDGVIAYVDASPVAKPLYARFGFEEKNTQPMPAPYDWYIESFMVRPKKS